MIRGLSIGLLVAALSGCNESSRKPTIPTIPESTLLDEVVDRILHRALGPYLEGRATAAAEVRIGLAAKPLFCSVELPSRLRASRPDGSVLLMNERGSWTWTASEPPRVANDADRLQGEQLLEVFSAARLMALGNAQPIARDMDNLNIQLRDEGGTTHVLCFDPVSLKPLGLTSGETEFQFLSHFESEVTFIPTHVQVADRAYFIDTLDLGIEFEDDAFEPQRNVGTPQQRPRLEVELEQAYERRWLMVPDPGSWAAREAAMESAGNRLGANGWGGGGDPVLVEDDLGTWFVVQYLEAQDSPRPITKEAGERDLARPERRVLRCEAPPGDFEERQEAAREALRAYAEAKGLELDGPIYFEINIVHKRPSLEPDVLRSTPLCAIVALK